MLHLKKPIKILRPFNVFGETQSNKAVIPELIEKFIKNKKVKLPKVYKQENLTMWEIQLI